ncbi:MAG: glycosyltransferase family 1 protein [Acidobacteriaceae bacterium]
MKPIAINGRFLTQPVTGVQRHARELIFTMDQMLASGELERPEQPVELLVPPTVRERPQLQYIKPRRGGRFSGHRWEQLSLHAGCRGKVLFTPCGGAPLLHRDHVFVVPDAAVFATPGAYTRAYGTWYRWHHRHAAKMPGLRLLTVSEFSRQELARHLKIDAAQITVIPLGHEHLLRIAPQPEVLAKLDLKPGEYILAVGSANPNKNYRGLLQAFDILRRRLSREAKRSKLVVAGAVGISTGAMGQQENVVQTGYVSDGELRALYENAACFVFPSLYEGFGLPLLEAMALGCPVVSSNAASLSGLGEGAALLFDPASPEQMADSIERVMTDADLRKELSENGKRRAQQFRWEETARRTWAVLLEAAADR